MLFLSINMWSFVSGSCSRRIHWIKDVY